MRKLELRGEKEMALREIHDISHFCSEEIIRERQPRKRLSVKCYKKPKSKEAGRTIHYTT